MRRLTILLAAVGALMLLPASSAFAAGSATVDIQGTGSGEVNSEGGYFGGGEGEPPITCSYKSPGPPSGSCEAALTEMFEPTAKALVMYGIPAPGSEAAGFSVEENGVPVSSLSTSCSAFSELEGFHDCFLYEESENNTYDVTAFFCLEGTAVYKDIGTETLPNAVEFIECEGEEETGNALTVVKEGTGAGTVASNPAGIECGGTCKASFEANQKVTLTASPSAGSTFVSWKGCEKGGVNGRQCTVTMDAAKTVNAKFLTAYDVTVNRVGSGLGKVSSSPGGVLCLSNCASTTAAFKEGTSVTLSAAPSKNYVFTEWTGDCSGSGTCSLGALGADKTVGAKFTAVAQHNLTVTKSGGGNGTVKSNLAGINCGATCSSMAAAYFQGQEVELTATPGKGSAFGGWSGSGCSGTGTCKVAISAAKSVTAEFK